MRLEVNGLSLESYSSGSRLSEYRVLTLTTAAQPWLMEWIAARNLRYDKQYSNSDDHGGLSITIEMNMLF